MCQILQLNELSFIVYGLYRRRKGNDHIFRPQDSLTNIRDGDLQLLNSWKDTDILPLLM